LSPATVSHHLKELHEAGLVDVEREGKYARISLRRDAMKAYANELARLGARKRGSKKG
jgi:ArsR family transcriptional regulator